MPARNPERASTQENPLRHRELASNDPERSIAFLKEVSEQRTEQELGHGGFGASRGTAEYATRN